MTGALLGDLAAWTWENEPDKFYPQLVSINSQISSRGKILLDCCNALLDNKDIEYQLYERIFDHVTFKDKEVNALVRSIVVGWIFDAENDVIAIQNYSLHEEKEDWYATNFLAKLICVLRKGATKKEAALVEHIGVFRDFVIDWKDGKGPLSILVRAWIAFFDSFDFTSAMHNAMKLPGDKHVNAIIVGGLAGAMYGCDQLLLKKKYDKDTTPYNCIVIPENLRPIVSKFKSFELNARTFFPKNKALTNVELHQWKEIIIAEKYRKLIINKELRRRILKAFDTGWDCRYGFYLDDGRVYVYRSGVLLCRFNLCVGKPIEHFQIVNDVDKSVAILGFESAMDTVEYYWHMASTEEKPKNLDYCKYYHGETRCPEQYQNSVKASFWHGEMLFITHNENMSKWKRIAKKAKSSLSKEGHEMFDKYSIDEFAVILFIKSAYEKWNPYEDTYWIKDY